MITFTIKSFKERLAVEILSPDVNIQKRLFRSEVT